MLKHLAAPIALLAACTFGSAQTFKVLHNFGDQPGDPTGPRNAGVVSQSRGGYMFSSADDHWTDQRGAAFRITPGGTLTVLHRFALPGAIRPVGGLVLATDGLYYGANKTGGTYGYGNIFKMKQGGVVIVLHTFNPTDNALGCSHPYAPPIEGTDGAFYGTAYGDGKNNGCVYRISSSGQFTVLHTFNGADGRQPWAPLVQASNSYFYGSTRNGGPVGYGTLFRVSSSGDFQSFPLDGNIAHPRAFPEAPMIQGSDGNLYGTTENGAGPGTVFQMTPTGALTFLMVFGGSNGAYPIGGLVQATDGYFYGTTDSGGANGQGELYRISATGDFAVLHDFDGNNGGHPENTLMQHTNGILYGTTEEGGSASMGTFFSFDLGLTPFVTYLPSDGHPGSVVEILGQGFTASSQVSFNGTLAASPVVVYPTYLRATVPSGATTGPITVTTASGTLTSNKVFVVQP